MIKSLFLTYPWIGLNGGGLRIQIEQTKLGLERNDVVVQMADVWKNQIAEADILHAFGTDASMLHHVRHAKAEGKAVVVSSVYNAFHRSLAGNVARVALATRVRGLWHGLRDTCELLHLADRIICLNDVEARLVSATFGIASDRLSVVPNGIDARFSLADGVAFFNRYGLKDFVLHVGRICPTKNQLTLIRALNDSDQQLVILGSPSSQDQAYFKKCKREASRSVTFIEAVRYDDPLLPSAYAAAKVFALPSFTEVMPLVLYEAAAAGCSLVASKTFPVDSRIDPYVGRCNPRSVSDVRDAVLQAARGGSSAECVDVVENMLSWDCVAKEVCSLYAECLP